MMTLTLQKSSIEKTTGAAAQLAASHLPSLVGIVAVSFKRSFLAGLRFLILFLICSSGISGLRANSEIFPATPAAIEKINWKDGYFCINGQPTFLSGGEMHYARIPRELWRDRLWRMKQMGFNCVQTYVFWNAQEGRDGVWDFTDNLDLEAWLNLIQEMGMTTIVRVGPYCCAEWETGGFPSWLLLKPGMTIRDNGAEYLRYVDRYLSKVYAIVKPHQVHLGGDVIMVQLENEHSEGWGTDSTPYLQHLYDQARAAGLEVPLFFSGLHHSPDPAGETPFPVGTTPWYTTEFWTGWIGHYGEMSTPFILEKIRGTWKIIAFGGAGFSFYMVHGGTNFGYSGNDSMDATYDYSAPIGEAGQLREFYHSARRAALFAQSFSNVLTSSKDDPGFAKASAPELRVTSRTSPNGTIVFVDHFLKRSKSAPGLAPQLPPEASAYKDDLYTPEGAGILTTIHLEKKGTFPTTGEKLNIQAREPKTLLFDLPWTPNATLSSVLTNVLLRQKIGSTEYWVCYGQPGKSGEINIERKAKSDLPSKVTFTYPKDSAVTEIPIDSGDNQKICLLVMNLERTNRTWQYKDQLLIGPDFVREDGTPEFSENGGEATVYKASGKSQISCAKRSLPELPKLAGWSWRDAAKERQPDYPDASWASSEGAQPMETYHDFQNRYGWYRTVLHSDKDGTVPLFFTGQSGRFSAYLNGKPTDLKSLALQKGENSLSIFLKIGYRPKLYKTTGALGYETAKGIWGAISLSEPTVAQVVWKKLSIPPVSSTHESKELRVAPDLDDSKWETLAPSNGVIDLPKTNQFTCYRGTFNAPENFKDCILDFPHMRPNVLRFYLNGKPVNNTGLDTMKSDDLSKWLVPGRNVIAFLLHESKNDKKVDLSLKFYPKAKPVTWRFRGGLADLEETPIIGRATNWADFMAKPWNSQGTPQKGQPTLWMTHFDYHPTGLETIGITTTGLYAGHVWLNGHNLGESPQKVPLYAPECWLKDGVNDLVVFDIGGAKPDSVSLERYEFRQVSTK